MKMNFCAQIMAVSFLFSWIFILTGCQNRNTLVDVISYRQAERDPQGMLLERIRVLSLDDACRIALKNNPSYQEAQQAVVSVKMRYYQALGAYSPTIFAAGSLGDQHYDGSGGSADSGNSSAFYTYNLIQAQWVLFDGLTREFTMLSARKSMILQKHLEENAARLLLKGVAFTYFDLLLSKTMLRIAEADREFQESMVRESSRKYAAGTVPYTDVLNFRGELNQARETILSARYQLKLNTYSLAVLMGYARGKLPESLEFPEFGAVKALEERYLAPVEVYLDLALVNRPDLKAQRERVRIAEYDLYGSYGAFLPMVSTYLNYSYSSNDTKNSGNNPTGFANFYLAGSSFNYGGFAVWNLFNGFIHYNKLRAARSTLEASRQRGADHWLSVVQEVRNAFETCRYAADLVRLCRENRSVMLQQRDMVAKEYRAGTVEVTRLNNAQYKLIRAENALAAAEIKARKAQEQLDAATNSNALGLRRKDDFSPQCLEAE